MKFEDMHVKCKTVEQRKQVESILLENGFEFVGVEIYGYKDVCVSAIAKVFAHTVRDNHQKQYNFEDFMEKYEKQNEMIETINKAKSELKMNDSELSLALGKSRQYIGKMLRLPQSKKVQDKVIKEINEFIDKAKDQKKFAVEDIKVSLSVDVGPSEKDKQISDLKKANEQQKIVIDKLDDQLIKAEKIHNEDVKLLDAKDKINANLEEKLEQSKRETEYFINQFKRAEDKLKELKSSHTTSKALNWFFVVAIILAAIVWKAYNG